MNHGTSRIQFTGPTGLSDRESSSTAERGHGPMLQQARKVHPACIALKLSYCSWKNHCVVHN